ncbi:transposase [Micromonospora sp. CPCC 206060]|uniref:transposase n=1 Tax=Micromonospora sp. CPCC 206060 TaxID=3122406 RepID=UPI002FF404BD
MLPGGAKKFLSALTELVETTGSSLQDLNGIGFSGAARLIGDIGDISRVASRGHFASWNGTAPLDAALHAEPTTMDMIRLVLFDEETRHAAEHVYQTFNHGR